MRCNIIFHSIGGNIYLIARSFKEALALEGVDTRLYRILDSDLHVLAADRNDVNEYYEEIEELPVANNEKLRSADLIMFGLPSRFGMPSAEFKTFLDNTADLFESRELEGKLYYSFATSTYSHKDALDAIEATDSWAAMMGLYAVDFPQYTHKDGLMMPSRPGQELEEVAKRFASTAASLLKES